MPLSDVQIQVASDGKLEVASTKDFELKKATFSEELQKEAQQPFQQSDPRVSQVRPVNQIKPGNPIYVRVNDPDRDLTDECDEVIVKLAADSGDEVQVKLKETGPHTGVFEGVVKTGELPAGATATDSAIDMKDLRRVARVRVAVPDPTNRAPTRAELQGSYDGAYWFRLGGYPGIGRCEPVAGSYGRMKRRVYAGNYTSNAAYYGDPRDRGPAMGAGCFDLYSWTYAIPQQDLRANLNPPGGTVVPVFGSTHATSFNMTFCDGSGRQINYMIDRMAHAYLGSRNGGHPFDPAGL